ncbi:MAG: MBL fold metallo-hydrolase [Paracoccaceae bacterium]|nr:MBL fold metallo-hydrolase [Paracoccaceae bacterium]
MSTTHPATVHLLGVKGGPAIRPGSHMPTSVLVRIGGKTILVDAGLGAARGVCDAGVALPEIDLILITHLHSDHYLELGPLLHTTWTAGLSKTIPLIGPEGLDDYWRHFLRSMAFDIELRIRDEGRNDLTGCADISVLREGAVWSEGGLTIRAMRNVHPPIEDSFALRIEAEGRSVVISGDTAPMDAMVEFARGADVLVHEAMLTDGVEAVIAKTPNGDDRLRTHILRSHSAAEEVGRIAREAEVGHLALNHLLPDGLPGFSETDWERAVREHWSGPLTIGRDGVTIRIDG